MGAMRNTAMSASPLAGPGAGAANAASPALASSETTPGFDVDELVRELRRTSRGLTTGWRVVDELGVQFRPKELALLAARTGHGKTSALVNIAMHWLENDLEGTMLYYSHEEPPEHILCRFIALLALKPIQPWTVSEIREYLANPTSRKPGHRDSDVEILNRAIERLRAVEHRLIVIHRPAWSAERLADHARSVAENQRIGAIFVDYLQRLPVHPMLHARDQEVAAIGRALKTLAVDVAAPVIAGVQVNREVIPAGYQDKVRKAASGSISEAIEVMKAARPDLNYLREGGSEQEADLILGLMNFAADLRVEATAVQANTDYYEIGVLKNRYGPTGRWAGLSYSGASGLISDVGAAIRHGEALTRLSA
jgi:replicative DNA helicase